MRQQSLLSSRARTSVVGRKSSTFNRDMEKEIEDELGGQRRRREEG